MRCFRSFAARQFLFVGIAAALFPLVITGCGSSQQAPFDLSQATFVGRDRCVSCHQKETELHVGSHHDLAMQLATDETVLADFSGIEFEHHGMVSRFFRNGKRFMVHTEGPDGNMRDFEVKYVFGFEPLQQYMVEFPSSGKQPDNTLPRIQVLRLSWDTEQEKWFYLPPPDVPEKLEPTDDLHWTGIAQRWNNMCAECHSTNYQKNFSPPESHTYLVSTHKAKRSEASSGLAEDLVAEPYTGRYQSTFMDIDVSCEACHGPGSLHVELAQEWFPGWNRERGYGLANLKASAENEIQACAPCHSRRGVVHAGFRAHENFYDYYTNTLLEENIYYADGQILDEDYVHGSFIQSKMYHKGIKCTDCHDPHTARLKHEGNQVCTSCHQHPAAKYDTVAHHFHEPGTEGAQCVNCHMPATTYMEVDPRRDHSFRIPRPDLSLQLGTPNACTGCHLNIENISPDKRANLQLYQDWMQAARDGDDEIQAEISRADDYCEKACQKWYGENRRLDKHFGTALTAGRRRDENATELLRDLIAQRGYEAHQAPAVARATAIQLLARVNPEAAAEEAEGALKDDHPLVRSASAAALAGSTSPTKSVSLLERALNDPIRSVRTEAARALLEFPRNLWGSSSGSAFRRALSELVEGLEYNNDRAGAHLTLGVLAEQQGRDQQAIRHYETAIRVEPTVTGPRTNLAALLERNSNSTLAEGGASSELQMKIDRLRKEELDLLERDARLLPDSASIQYRYGLALYIDGQMDAAADRLVKAAELAPGEASFAQAAAMLFESQQEWSEALRWGERALRLSGNDPQYMLLMQRIRASAEAARP